MTSHALWWNDGGPYRLLHQWMPLRMDFLIRHLPWPKKDLPSPSSLTLIDVGCGGGLVSFPLARKGWRVWGIDPDPVAIACAQSHQANAHHFHSASHKACQPKTTFDSLQLTYLCQDPVTWEPTEPVNAIVLFEVLEHTPDPSALLLHLMSWLAPGGVIVGSTINQTSWSALTSITMAQDVLGLVPDNLHTWESFVTPSTIQSIIQPLTPHPLLTQGCMYYPGLGWQYTSSCQGNYFFVIQCSHVQALN